MSFDPSGEQMCGSNAGVSVLPSVGQGADQGQVEAERNVARGNFLDMMTPAQAYAHAVKTGQDYNRTLHYTIERKQPLRNAPDQPTPLSLSSVNASTERGGLYAQRLYASATSNRSASSLPSSNSPTKPTDKPPSVIPPVPAVPDIRPLTRSHHHRSSSRSPSVADTSVPGPATRTFNVADLYHSSLPRGDIRSLRTCLSGPGSFPPTRARTEPAPLSAPPLHAPTPLAAYPLFQASVSQMQLPQDGALSSPLSPEGFLSGRPRHNLSAHDVQHGTLNRPSSCAASSPQAPSSVSVPAVHVMTPPLSTSPRPMTDRLVGRSRNVSPSFSLPAEKSALQGTSPTVEEHYPSQKDLPLLPPFESAISSVPASVPVLKATSSPMSPSPLSSERPSSIASHQQEDLPRYTPSDHPISSSSPPFGDEKSELPYRSVFPSPAEPSVDRRVLPAVPLSFQSPRLIAQSHGDTIISTSPPSVSRSPPSRSSPRSTESLSAVGNSPPPHSETSVSPVALRTPEPTVHPTEQPAVKNSLDALRLPNPYDQERDEGSHNTSSSAPSGPSLPTSLEPSQFADDLMDAIENLMGEGSSRN
ncbi:hypothetical protein EDC04DRAFT_2675105 [Pisolithus marmoratus]|nr:hypothetical protein EDC04DRAFT_2675105 [Pisolithus marmoratus]